MIQCKTVFLSGFISSSLSWSSSGYISQDVGLVAGIFGICLRAVSSYVLVTFISLGIGGNRMIINKEIVQMNGSVAE